MRRPLYPLALAAALAGCSGDDPAGDDAGPAPDAAADAGLRTDGGQAPDAGETPDAGEAPDAGASPEPQAVLQLRELDVVVFGGEAVGSALIARPAAVFPTAGCVQRTDDRPSLPRLGAITAQGLSIAELVCTDDVGTGIDGTRCLSQGAAPPPIPGSTLDTGPWLTEADPTLSVAAGADLGAVSVTLAPPAVGANVTEPTALPTTVDGDLTVQWAALGHTDVQIEVEVQTGQSVVTTLCAPDRDGEVRVPEALLGEAILRISVANYAEAVVRDDQDRALRVQVMRGRIIAE